MDNTDSQYMFLLDLRDYIRNGKAREIIKDLQVYFPDEYETFMEATTKQEKSKHVAALLRASSM